jgi:hypothetical protein
MQKRLLALAAPAALAALALPFEARAQAPVTAGSPGGVPLGPQAAPYPGAPGYVEAFAPHAPEATVRRPEPPAGPWGLHNGDTVEKGHTLLYGELGWPEMSTGFQRGVASYADVGFRFQIIYGVDYVLPKGMSSIQDVTFFGIGMSVPIRLTVVRTERVSFLAHLDPGIKFDYLDPIFVGPQLPIGFELGMHLTRRSTLTLGLDVPISIRVMPDLAGIIPFLFGLAFEGHVNDHFGLVLNARTGVVHGFNRTGGDTDLGLILQGGFVGRI